MIHLPHLTYTRITDHNRWNSALPSFISGHATPTLLLSRMWSAININETGVIAPEWRTLYVAVYLQDDTGDRHTRSHRCVHKIYHLETQSRLDGYLWCTVHECNVSSYLNNYGVVSDVRFPTGSLPLRLAVLIFCDTVSTPERIRKWSAFQKSRVARGSLTPLANGLLENESTVYNIYNIYDK